MTINKNDKRFTLLKPGNEYKDYCEFCEKHKETPVSELELFKIAYFLAVRSLVFGFENGTGSYVVGSLSLAMFQFDFDKNKNNLALAIFVTSDFEEFEKEQIT
jgi:hypothetical protein